MNSIFASPAEHNGANLNAESRFVHVRALANDERSPNDAFDRLERKLIGDSHRMHELRRSIRMVASSDETVLITGESGTGKELIARALHDLSRRRGKPFVAVNCGALSESLLESELFGHVKGAFTGAATHKKGFFEAASGGTIFLDEFAEMSLATQQRLLRVLQDRTVRPVGSTDAKEIEIDTRIVVATNHDLKRDVSEGKFRHDLYYRVNVLQINSPALRDRREDILALAEHFIGKYNDKNSAKVSERISSEVVAVLEAYSWPGNVRELENVIKRLALNASHHGVITEADLQNVPELERVRLTVLPVIGLSEVSRKLNCISRGKKESEPCRHDELLNDYRQLLDETGGNLTEAARRLNIKRTTLRKRIISLQKKCAAG
jgi:two-component system, NtrC family, response regulator AtoC